MGIPELVKAALSPGRKGCKCPSPQQPLVLPKHTHLAQALLGFPGFCVTGSHRAAKEVKVVLGLLHLP